MAIKRDSCFEVVAGAAFEVAVAVFVPLRLWSFTWVVEEAVVALTGTGCRTCRLFAACRDKPMQGTKKPILYKKRIIYF